MKGFVEHDSAACDLGAHANRGGVDGMCPAYLEVRRYRLRKRMRQVRREEAAYRMYNGDPNTAWDDYIIRARG